MFRVLLIPVFTAKRDIKTGKNCLIIAAVYVDDTILASSDKAMLTAEKTKLRERFEIEYLGEINHYLGMCIRRDRKRKVLMISQKSYLENVLKRFGMQDCKPVSTPIENAARYEKLTDDEKPLNTREYQAVIGSLTYASIATRPDLSVAV